MRDRGLIQRSTRNCADVTRRLKRRKGEKGDMCSAEDENYRCTEKKIAATSSDENQSVTVSSGQRVHHERLVSAYIHQGHMTIRPYGHAHERRHNSQRSYRWRRRARRCQATTSTELKLLLLLLTFLKLGRAPDLGLDTTTELACCPLIHSLLDEVSSTSFSFPLFRGLRRTGEGLALPSLTAALLASFGVTVE